MPSFDDELLKIAKRLLARSSGQRGKLPGATVRRSVSTAYYALFHFLVDEAGRLLIGTENKYRRRRHVLGRSLTHDGLKAALSKVRGPVVDPSVAELLRPTGRHTGPVLSPLFVQEMAAAFADAQSKRHDADYDLNKKVTASDAQILIQRVERAILAGLADRPLTMISNIRCACSS